MRGRSLVVLSAVAVAMVGTGLLVARRESGPGETGAGVVAVDVAGLRPGRVMPIEASLPDEKHRKVRVFVVRPSGHRVIALLGISTHLGCSLKWVGDPDYARFSTSRGVTYEDPCGGSVFALDGSWCGGPAPRALDRFLSHVVGDHAEIDLNHLVRSPRRQITHTDACSA